MKKTLLIFGIIAALSSCDRNGLDVEDKSFSFSTAVAFESEANSYCLYLTLLSGSRTEEYTLDYMIDGSPAIRLLSSQGTAVSSGASMSLSGGSSVSFRLPVLSLGHHNIHLEVSGKDYTWKEDFGFDISRTPLSVYAEINTNKENPNSTMLISLREGVQEKVYDIAIDIDGTPVEMDEAHRKADFSKMPILAVTLPTIRPGTHDAVIRIFDETNSSESELSFEEPARFPYLDLVFSHDPKSGNHILTVSRNPYGIHIKLSSLLSVTGSCTYWLGGRGWDSYPYASEYQRTKSKTVTDSRSMDITGGGEFVVAGRDKAVEELTSQYEMSAVWGEVCDSENCYWTVSLYEPHYYKLESESLTIEGEIESVPGITARISGSIANSTWNGAKVSTAPISIKL